MSNSDKIKEQLAAEMLASQHAERTILAIGKDLRDTLKEWRGKAQLFNARAERWSMNESPDAAALCQAKALAMEHCCRAVEHIIKTHKL
jgi:hypothetical protein